LNDDDHRAWKAAPEGRRKQFLMTQMLKANEPLADKFLARITKFSKVICDHEDLMQAARIGLWQAITKYDPNRPTRFSTMCWHWVRYHVSVELTRQPPIRRPRGSGPSYQQVRASERFMAIFGRIPTAEDLGVPQAEFDRWAMTEWRFGPLDQATGESDQRELAIDSLLEAEMDARLHAALDRLPEYQKQVALGEKISGLNNAQTEDLRQRVLEYLRDELDDS
jgi:RNA polymerase sigma factor (sigma-70 family)